MFWKSESFFKTSKLLCVFLSSSVHCPYIMFLHRMLLRIKFNDGLCEMWVWVIKFCLTLTKINLLYKQPLRTKTMNLLVLYYLYICYGASLSDCFITRTLCCFAPAKVDIPIVWGWSSTGLPYITRTTLDLSFRELWSLIL